DVLGRHAAGFDPGDLEAAGIRPVAGPAEVRAAREAAAGGGAAAEALGYPVDLCRAPRRSPAVQLGASPRGATALLRTRRGWRARPPTGCWTACSPPSRSRADRNRPQDRRDSGEARMAITGRTVLAAFAGTLVVLAVGSLGAWTAWAVIGALALLVAVDLALAPSARRVSFERSGETGIRLGESAEVELVVVNPSGRRLRGVLRDAWAPSSGARPERHPLS